MSRDATLMLFEFHHKYNQPINVDHSDMNTWVSQINMIQEEVKELFAEWEGIRLVLERGDTPSNQQMSRFLKEMCDCEYVLRGTGVAFGLPYPAGFVAVHESNMTKTGKKDGGKQKKGRGYKAPDMLALFK